MSRSTFGPGARVEMLCDGFGDVDDVETHFQPGELGTVTDIDWYEHQGVAITILMDCGVVNVFDDVDTRRSSRPAFRLVAPAPSPDAAARAVAWVADYDGSLNTAEVTANCYDYDEVVSAVRHIASGGKAPAINITDEGR